MQVAHTRAVHQTKVVTPNDLRQIQADEMHLKIQAGVLWLALVMIVSTGLGQVRLMAKM
jgi:hypothetical protein